MTDFIPINRSFNGRGVGRRREVPHNLVERDQEEKTMARVFSESGPGRIRSAVISGPPASGKSALLDSFARDAAIAGATVLTARAMHSESRQPRRIVDQLLREFRLSAHASAENGEKAERVSGHDQVSAPVPDALGDALQQRRGSSAMIICLYDAHFMDIESARYLLGLVRQKADLPISIVLTYCPEAGDDRIHDILRTEVLEMPGCTRLEVEPLSEKGIATVLESYFTIEVASRIAADCRRLSGGRPALVHALAEDFSNGTPEPAARRPLVAGPAFGDAVLSCLRRADPVVLKIAQAMTTLGDFRSMTAVARLVGSDSQAVERLAASPGIGGLLDHELLAEPSVRVSVLRSIPYDERQALRARAARLRHEAVPAAETTGRPTTRVPATLGAAGASGAGQAPLPLPLPYPGIEADPEFGNAAAMGGEPGTPGHRAAAALGAILQREPGYDAVPAAENVLREALSGAATAVPSLAALMVLIYSDSLEKASVWCDAVLASRAQSYTPVWNAMFATQRAEILYRRGALAEAKRQAQGALGLLPSEDWGAAIAVPLSLLVLIATAMGDLAEAERALDIAVPSAAFGTLGGVTYLDARGQFHLSRGHHDTALQDFMTAGHLMKLWKTDCPSAVPWRTHAAHALLHKGQVAQAREMIAEQMSLLPDGHPRTRGLTGRALAATLRLDQRPPVLLEAASTLDRCGDSLNLAQTLADLGHTYTSLGELARGRSYAHQAKELADRCDAVLLSTLPVTAGEETDEESQNDARRLSSAECRVAELAALGNTNEQIARKLYITVSTVEQHLTRIYRKLGIRRRTQLPSSL